MQGAILMSKVTLLDDLNSYNSKALIRAKIKEVFFPNFPLKFLN